MGHMPYTGQAGFDLYIGKSYQDMKFYRTSNFDFNKMETYKKFINEVSMCTTKKTDKDGNMVQKTEESIGKYELHDFFLFYLIHDSFSPSKILFLANLAFDKRYDQETIIHWLRTFCRRFFAQQFKRSALPDGVKVGSVSISPRGDWMMPSDAVAAAWMRECDKLN